MIRDSVVLSVYVILHKLRLHIWKKTHTCDIIIYMLLLLLFVLLFILIKSFRTLWISIKTEWITNKIKISDMGKI